jgi:hypothetical protein
MQTSLQLPIRVSMTVTAAGKLDHLLTLHGCQIHSPGQLNLGFFFWESVHPFHEVDDQRLYAMAVWNGLAFSAQSKQDVNPQEPAGGARRTVFSPYLHP